MNCESVFARMEKKENQKDDAAVLRELQKRIDSGEWARSLWAIVLKDRQFAVVSQEDEHSNRPKLRKRTPNRKSE